MRSEIPRFHPDWVSSSGFQVLHAEMTTEYELGRFVPAQSWGDTARQVAPVSYLWNMWKEGLAPGEALVGITRRDYRQEYRWKGLLGQRGRVWRSG